MYNVVIIGAGNIGAFFDTPSNDSILTHAHAAVQNKNFHLLGFFDIDHKRSEEAAKLWSCKAFETFETAMEAADVVCCAVPDQYHFDMLKSIADYPVKFVFAEKPITSTVSQANAICSLYKERNIPVNVNYSRRFLDETAVLKKKRESFGSFICGTGYYGKGILHNGSHMIDLIINLLGNITDYKSRNKIYDFFDEDPSVEATLEVAGGKINLVPVDCRKVTIFELELFFDNTRVRIINSGYQIEIYEVKPSEVYAGYYNYQKTGNWNVDYSKAMMNAYDNIFNVLQKQEEVLSPIEDAAKVLEICCNLQKNG